MRMSENKVKKVGNEKQSRRWTIGWAVALVPFIFPQWVGGGGRRRREGGGRNSC